MPNNTQDPNVEQPRRLITDVSGFTDPTSEDANRGTQQQPQVQTLAPAPTQLASTVRGTPEDTAGDTRSEPGDLPNLGSGGTGTDTTGTTGGTFVENILPGGDTIKDRVSDIAVGDRGPSERTTAIAHKTDIGSGITAQENVQQLTERQTVDPSLIDNVPQILATLGVPVTTGTQNPINTTTMDPTLVSESPVVTAAQGVVSNIASADGPLFDPQIDGTVISPSEIQDGFSQNVQGALSSGALAQAAQGVSAQFQGDVPTADALARVAATIDSAVTGTASSIDTGGLPRLGDIDLMPVDAVAVVAELPTEALVTTQLDTLLQGITAGITPAWALPAVEAVEASLAQRGMSASSVGRTALFSAIVASATPLAQSNATAIKDRANLNLSHRQQTALQNAQLEGQARIVQFTTVAEVATSNAQLQQQMTIANMSAENQINLANLQALNDAGRDNLNAAQQTELANMQAELAVGTLNAQLANEMGVANLSARQQTAISNAAVNAQWDMNEFNNKQQVALANSAWMQTATLTNADNAQKAAIQQATLMVTTDIAAADQRARLAIQNSQNFLAMDVANLNNEQQALISNAQLDQQRLLSNQSATNAALQFNAASQNQTDQFMAGLAAEIEQSNVSQLNAMAQFNANQDNIASAQNAQNSLAVQEANAQLSNQINIFNADNDFRTDQWNAANAQAVEQSNITWRRNANTADTAVQNAINQQSALNSFNMEKAALDMLWQETRDQAAFDQQNHANHQTQIANLYATALSHEEYAARSNYSAVESVIGSLNNMFRE